VVIVQKKVDEFLRRTGMHYERVALDENREVFQFEMRKGLGGEASSMLMLPTYISAESRVPKDKEIIVMDAGGTNFRVATVKFGENGPEIGYFDKTAMPGIGGGIGRDAFFDVIAERLLPVLGVSDTVGFCFSYPTEIIPDKDGRVIRMNKEVVVDDIEGELVGAGINAALARKGHGPKRFILLNDTVATMLGGIAVMKEQVYDGHIGYILGTGTNTCYLERAENITKSPEAVKAGGWMAVNMEAGGFSGVPMGDFDRALDDASVDPGSQLLEKMVAGAYQADLLFRTMGGAVKDGLFSRGFVEKFGAVSSFTMYDVDQFCFFPYGENVLAELCEGSGEDALTLFEIIDASFERAARLTAVIFAGILLHTGCGKNPTKPVCVTAEGTTFYKSKPFRQKLDFYVRSYLNDALGVYVEFTRAENATLVGTAVAALLN
jgi:hexokinase